MAAAEQQQQFLTLIGDFAAKKSQGERRISSLKRRIQELRSDLDAANADLEFAKRLKETTEREVKGYEVELAMNEASIKTIEARISLTRNELSAIGSDKEALKNEEDALRQDFMKKMIELNARIRKFQETMYCNFTEEICVATTSHEAEHGHSSVEVAESTRTLEKKLAQIIGQTAAEEQEYREKLNSHKQNEDELIQLNRKSSLLEVIVKESKEMQDLTRYPLLKYCFKRL